MGLPSVHFSQDSEPLLSANGQESVDPENNPIRVYPAPQIWTSRTKGFKLCTRRTFWGIVCFVTLGIGLVMFVASYFLAARRSGNQLNSAVVYERRKSTDLSSHYFQGPTISRAQAVAYAKKQWLQPKLAFRKGNRARNFNPRLNLSWKSVWSGEPSYRFDITANDVIVFIHIQKTGGTTLERYLTRYLNLSRPCVCAEGVKKCKCLRPLLIDHEEDSTYDSEEGTHEADVSGNSISGVEQLDDFQEKRGHDFDVSQNKDFGQVFDDAGFGGTEKSDVSQNRVANFGNFRVKREHMRIDPSVMFRDNSPTAHVSHQPLHTPTQPVGAHSRISQPFHGPRVSSVEEHSSVEARWHGTPKVPGSIPGGGPTFRKKLRFNGQISQAEVSRTLTDGGQWLFSRMSTGWSCGLHADWTELVTSDCVDNVLDRQDGVREKRRYFYITILREPVSRFISEYAHVRRGATWPSAHFCGGRPATAEELPLCFDPELTWRGVRLDQFLDCPYNLAFNRQTRMLADLRLVGCYNGTFRDPNFDGAHNPAGRTYDDRGQDYTSDRGQDYTFDRGQESPGQKLPSARDTILLASAKTNLKEMAWFGLLEDMDRTKRSFEATFDLQFKKSFEPPYRSKSNKTVVTAEQKMRITAMNNLDLELYEFAKSLFEKRWRFLEKMGKV